MSSNKKNLLNKKEYYSKKINLKPNCNKNKFSANNLISYMLLYKKRCFFIIISLSLIVFVFILFFFKSNNFLMFNGSTTVQPILMDLASAYKTESNDIKIAVGGGGSSLGVSNILKNTCDFGDASRFPNKLNEYFGSDYKSTNKKWNSYSTCPIGLDVLIFVINMPNYSNISLTANQIQKIYSGKITNWNSINPRINKSITFINREIGSGSRNCFYNAMNKYSYALPDDVSSENELIGVSNGQIIDDIKAKEGSIGYISLRYLNSLRKNNVIPSNIVLPDIKFKVDSDKYIIQENLINRKYNDNSYFLDSITVNIQNKINSIDMPDCFWHPLNIIFDTNNKKIKNIKKFLYFIFNKDTGQNVVKNKGYIPLYAKWSLTKNDYYYTADSANGYPFYDSKQFVDNWIMKTDTNEEKTSSQLVPWWRGWITPGLYN